MKSSTSPFGRDVKTMGNPLKMTEIVATLPGTYYVTRQSVHTPANVKKTKESNTESRSVSEARQRNLLR